MALMMIALIINLLLNEGGDIMAEEQLWIDCRPIREHPPTSNKDVYHHHGNVMVAGCGGVAPAAPADVGRHPPATISPGCDILDELLGNQQQRRVTFHQQNRSEVPLIDRRSGSSSAAVAQH